MNFAVHALTALAIAAGPAVAIIIDDIGDREADGRRVVALPGPVALAFLPHAPYTDTLAEVAHAAGKEVMLHLPLQAENGKDPGPGAILLDTGEAEFARIFATNIAAVPHAVGVNNHMGSLLTRHPGHMAWLMQAIAAERTLFFIDSYTAAESVALTLAREAGIPAARRNVFLDSDPSVDAVEFQFDRLLAVARAEGSAIAIGHPYPSTLEVLERRLPELAREGITLVRVADVIALQGRGSDALGVAIHSPGDGEDKSCDRDRADDDPRHEQVPDQQD